MKPTAIITLVATMLIGCAPGAPETPASPARKPDVNAATPNITVAPDLQTELAKLEGKWTGVSFHVDGFESPVAKWYKYSFDGDKMTTETSEGEPATVKFYIDPQAEPKQLDTSITVNGVEEISKGIYSVDDTTLRLSWRVIGDRPTDFQSRELDEKIVIVLRRAED